MNDSRPPDPAHARQAFAATSDQRMDQCAVGVARRGVDDEPRRLVNDDEVLVLVDDLKGQIFPDERRILRRRGHEFDARARKDLLRRIAGDCFVDLYLSALDQGLKPGARQGEPLRGRSLAQEAVEPFTRACGVDDPNLRSLRRAQRRLQAEFSCRVTFRLDPPARRAARGLRAHARPRRRDRAAVSAAGGATRSPSAATIASRSGLSPGL